MKYPEVNSLSLFLQVLAKVFNTKVVQGYSADVEFNQSGGRQGVEQVGQGIVAHFESLNRKNLDRVELLQGFSYQFQAFVS